MYQLRVFGLMFINLTNYCQNVYLTFLLCIVTIFGDYLVSYTKIHVFQAIFDNVTHGIVGGLSWFIFRINYKSFSTRRTLIEVALTTLCASLIDLDHFVAARSFYLNVKHFLNV